MGQLKRIEQVVKEIHKAYPWAKGLRVEVVDGWGLVALRGDSLVLFLEALAECYTQARYVRRFGAVKTFPEFVRVVLLHELRHVWQVQEHGAERVALDYRSVLDKETHDDNWLEVDADQWAVAEYKRRWV